MLSKTLVSRFCFVASLLCMSSASFAFPDLNQPIGTNGLPLKVYKDRDSDVYWYIPISIDPWTRDSRYQSTLYDDGGTLSFIFRGQASVDPKMLAEIAQNIGVPLSKFTPIAYDYSKDLTCQNIFASDPSTTWLFPKAIGNYLELVPLSFRTTNPAIAKEAAYHIKHGGLACTVSVGFKAHTIAYKAYVHADLMSVYSRFEAALHGEYFIFEVDAHTLLEKMRTDGIIEFKLTEDTSIPQTEWDKKFQAAWEDVESKIMKMLFTPALKIPDGPMAGRGKPFSLRADYRRSTEQKVLTLNLSSDKILTKDSQIGIRMAIE